MRFFFFVFSCLECECDPLQTQSQHTLFGFIGAGFSLCILIAKFNDINAVMSTVHLAMCSLVRFGLVFIFDYCARTRLRCDCAIVQCSPRYIQTNRLWPVCWIGPLVQVKCHFPSGKKTVQRPQIKLLVAWNSITLHAQRVFVVLYVLLFFRTIPYQSKCQHNLSNFHRETDVFAQVNQWIYVYLLLI